MKCDEWEVPPNNNTEKKRTQWDKNERVQKCYNH